MGRLVRGRDRIKRGLDKLTKMERSVDIKRNLAKKESTDKRRSTQIMRSAIYETFPDLIVNLYSRENNVEIVISGTSTTVFEMTYDQVDHYRDTCLNFGKEHARMVTPIFSDLQAFIEKRRRQKMPSMSLEWADW